MLPTLLLKNQYGEPQNSTVLGGSLAVMCNFKVASSDSGGNGITNLQSFGSPGVSAVYMHTSATASSGNPNPAAGLIVVQFAVAFAGFISFLQSRISPLSGTNVNVTSGLTQYAAYCITAVGTTTAAQWQTLGLPANVTPAVGATFIAATSSAGSGTGVVQAIKATGSGVNAVEVFGTLGAGMLGLPVNSGGGQIILACFAPTSSSVTTPALTAPADGSYISLGFQFTPEPTSLI